MHHAADLGLFRIEGVESQKSNQRILFVVEEIINFAFRAPAQHLPIQLQVQSFLSIAELCELRDLRQFHLRQSLFAIETLPALSRHAYSSSATRLFCGPLPCGASSPSARQPPRRDRHSDRFS